MVTTTNDDLYLASLQRLQQVLKEMGYESRILEKTDFIPIHSLLCGIEQDYKNRNRYVHFSYIPMPEDWDDNMLLQFYITLPLEIKIENVDTLKALLIEMNNHTAIGQFGINNDGAVCFRHVQVSTKAEPLTEAVFQSTLEIFVFMVDGYEDTIEAVATGQQDLSSAIKSL